MKHRPAPTQAPRHLVDQVRGRLQRDPQVRAWVKRLSGDPNATINGADENQLRFIMETIAQQRGWDFSVDFFGRALNQTTPLLSVPDMTDPVEDLGLIFSLPEMQRFWNSWDVPRGAAGPKINAEAGKALMALMAMPGLTTHADNAHWLLRRVPELRGVFERAGRDGRVRAAEDRETEIHPSLREIQPIDPMSYEGVLRGRPKVAQSVTTLAMETNIALAKDLRRLVGDRVGRGLLLDCVPVPAWAQQKGSGHVEDDPARAALEAIMRRHSPEAGFRSVRQTSGHKEDIKAGDSVSGSEIRSGRVKNWRGYYLAALADQATGLPLVWMVFDAQINEPEALGPLLSRLYRLWPEVGVDWIAGDSAFDTEDCCRLCEVYYGIHPIFRLHDERDDKDVPRGTVRGDKIKRLTHEGRLVCAVHDCQLDMAALEGPSRNGLNWGDPADRDAFRYRATCPKCALEATRAGRSAPRLSFPASFDFRRLAHFPHHRHGRPELYAFRQAILTTRMSQIESLWQALRGGYLISGTGAGRTRIRERHVHEALVSLAFLGRTALTVVDQRIQAGELNPGGEPDDGGTAEAGEVQPLIGAAAAVAGAARPALRAVRDDQGGSRGRGRGSTPRAAAPQPPLLAVVPETSRASGAPRGNHTTTGTVRFGVVGDSRAGGRD
jgi:hypothetical protein